ncbi:hypothetical protein MPTK1_8g01690 [Marchantia polymorpha subsp. ruderalis]
MCPVAKINHIAVFTKNLRGDFAGLQKQVLALSNNMLRDFRRGFWVSY